MSIVVNMAWSGLTPQQYDSMERRVGWREQPPAGGRYHLAWFDGSGGRIVDVWESAEVFDDFIRTRVMPGVAELGIAGEPDVHVYPLYDLQIEGDPPPGSVVVDGTAGGMPTAVYQGLERAVDWKSNPPAGAFVHIAALDEETVRDVGVWRTRESVDAFVSGAIATALNELGADDELEDEPTFELHRWFDPTRVKART